MTRPKSLGIILIAFISSISFAAPSLPACAEKEFVDYTVKGGCTVRARAYVEPLYTGKKASRYHLMSRRSLEIVRMPKNACKWDLTLAEDPNSHYMNVNGASLLAYGSKNYALLHATLHQYDTCEERVTFKNLDLGPLSYILFGKTFSPKKPDDSTPRYLVLREPVTATTLSGVSITLPVQGAETLEKVFSSFNGNASALFIQITTSPSGSSVRLPKSPLWRKYGKPVRVMLDCSPPNSMISYLADNTYKTIAVGLPNLKTVMHLYTLTLMVRQRVDLQAVPITIRVPISRAQTN